MSEPTVSLGILEEATLDLSTEAINLRGSFDSLRQKLPDFFGKLTGFVNGLLPNQELQLDMFNQRKYAELAKKGDYMTLRRRNVIVPKGLQVSYLKHLESLNRNQDAIDTLITEILSPFEKHLGTLLSNPETLKSQRESKIIDKVVVHDVAGLRSEMAKDFNKDSAERRPYGTVIGRQSDWPKITLEFNDLVERMARISRKEVLSYVELISEHLEKLIQRMETDPETYESNGLKVSELAKISFVMAEEVEFYATQAFMVEQLQVSIEAAAELVVSYD
jgi:F0F1-type ATP synthase delta subunit